jgi:hypothetical protein
MSGKIVAIEEIKKHSQETDCWIVVNDVVWDVTEFIPEHPGGNESGITSSSTLRLLLSVCSNNQACRPRRIVILQLYPLAFTHLQNS